MKHTISHHRAGAKRRARGRWRSFTSAACLVALMGLGSTSNARLKPYEVISDAGFSDIKPRVLFVLDTSGSMMWKTQEAVDQCEWSQCEDGADTERSRIATARAALQQVVSTVGDAGDFALMTFGQERPPTSVPPMCMTGNRFQWSDWYGFFYWDEIQQYGTHGGVWRLCDTANQGFPYLRWDELGVGSVIGGNDQAGAPPPSPLISTDEADITNVANSERRVQWFPKYMGTRVQLNATTDPDKSILSQTIGDWADTDPERDSEVYNHDFYYWPYVDGFPGYSAFIAFPGDPFPSRLGVQAESADPVSLFAPFYVDLSDTPIDPSLWGPPDSATARDAVLQATAPLIEGGVDADGDTPWADAIGLIPGVAPQDNSEFSHDTVASYLKFLNDNDESAACTPTSVVLITDGKPDDGQGGSTLYSRIAALREDLGVRVYVVGFFLSGTTEVNDMACAGAGACSGTCATPCDDTPTSEWDTCADPANPSSACAYTADSADELGAVLTDIVGQAIDLDIGSGQGSRLNDFGSQGAGGVDDGEVVQTFLEGFTEFPSWRGHVVRQLCTDEDPENPGDPASYCVDPGFDPMEDAEETFGPCPQSRSWDAGECLQMTAWTDRRVYTHDSDNDVFSISNPDGTASAQFFAELDAQGLLTSADKAAEADAIAAFILGRDWPDGWKLPGLATSSPTLARRVPPYKTDTAPSVAIRDPHCGGRVFPETSTVPSSLRDFATEAWDDALRLPSPTPHYEYQEAVLVGDDLGILHAFQYDSGNELWGFVPRQLLATAVEQSHNGAATMGQPDSLEDHIYGVSSTLNQGWVYDDRAADPADHEWVHLGIFGLGIGGTELYALDLSHMSPESPDGPIEILWTSEDGPIAADWDARLGETWSRPSIMYDVPGNNASSIPSARLVLGSGYGAAGNNFVVADALTGQIEEYASVTVPANRYGEYGTVADMAVSSLCLSGYWAEAQEVYTADPAGQLFRWDIGGDHEADSGGAWGTTAIPVTQFLACEGAGDVCTVGASGRGDIFTYSPAVSANDRIDAALSGGLTAGEDQILVALVSGSTGDDDIPPHDEDNEFHSSLYLMVDDHSSGDPSAGFDIPPGAPLTAIGDIGANPSFLRLAVTQIERTRTFTPYEGAPTYTETRNFSRRTRPLRSPRIAVTGVADEAEIIGNVEVYRITYTFYEPAADECDERWYDSSSNTWHFDPGAVFEVTFRLTALDGGGFDFAQGSAAGGGVAFSDLDEGLTLEGVQQTSPTEPCASGDCGTRATPSGFSPCQSNDIAAPPPRTAPATLRSATVPGFSPVE